MIDWTSECCVVNCGSDAVYGIQEMKICLSNVYCSVIYLIQIFLLWEKRVGEFLLLCYVFRYDTVVSIQNLLTIS